MRFGVSISKYFFVECLVRHVQFVCMSTKSEFKSSFNTFKWMMIFALR